MTPRVLGISAGEPGGSAEILLSSALAAVQNAEVQLVRLAGLRLDAEEDLPWLWERLVECDGLIVSTPIMSRTMSSRLKLLVDRLLGPNADAAIIEQLVALRRAGTEPAVPFRVDERVLRPRVAGFLAVGGSLTPQWQTLALPLMHTLTFSMHVAVVDQVVFSGAGTPRSILLDDDALQRAETLGVNVASQLGKAYDEVTYLGEPGLCPMCHLSVIELTGTAVACATCGCRGTLRVGSTRDADSTSGTGTSGTNTSGTNTSGTNTSSAIEWTDRTASVLSMAEKRAHAAEIQETAGRQRELRSTIA